MLAQDTARGLPLDFILRQQAQPHTWTDRQTDRPHTLPPSPGNTEVEITLLKTTGGGGKGHGGGRVRQVGGCWAAGHKALLCPTTPKYTGTFPFIHMYILTLHIPQIQLRMYTFFFCLILILTVTMYAT